MEHLPSTQGGHAIITACCGDRALPSLISRVVSVDVKHHVS